MTIVIDSDGFIGSLNSDDIHHLAAKRILLKLSQQNARLIYPATTVVETVTFLQGRLNKPELAEEVINLVEENQLNVEQVDLTILQEAGKLMDLQSSKHNTLFDCVVAAVAEEYKADAIFSFDKFYKSKGFKLASELK